jgi:hypothetical protein
MRRHLHQALLFSLLTLYGLGTVGGPALHVLPAFDHDRDPLATGDSKAPGPPDRHHKSPHDCPICHFKAQGQIDVEPAGLVLIALVRPHPTTAPPLSFPPTLERPSGPRAPPSA